ncbi:hypothetical protein ZIOFF_017045 [Zingiber officinale]|uniref:Uncharacterized protein n=1 Tax=Zingiber officinale TaxID=94328 RepID=A0A8J5HB90_ZINOF|nr:hypothetical protein ZIOFF_017045 [Zingiber officinale]
MRFRRHQEQLLSCKNEVDSTTIDYVPIRNPQEVRTTTLLDGSISLSFQGYQATKNPQTRRLSNFDTEEIGNEGEEEFAGVVTNEYAFPSFYDEYGYPDTNGRWDTLGEPSGKYNYYVNYAASPIQPFVPPTKPSWGDESENEDGDDDDKEIVLPSIWEDTPWEEDPYYKPEDLPEGEEYYFEEEDREVYFFALEDLDNNYPTISLTSVLHEEDTQQLSPYWDNSENESEEYWQQVVEQVEE